MIAPAQSAHISNVSKQFRHAVGQRGVDTSFIFPIKPAEPVPPVANYDFNNYSAYSSVIANTVSGAIGSATINQPSYNYYNTSSSTNKYLEIWVPYGGTFQTGGILLPYISGVRMIEMWVNLPVLNMFGQYLMDARNGAANGYWISGDYVAIGSDFTNGKIYFNTSSSVIDPNNSSPNVGTTIAGKGWYQIIVIVNTPFSDDIALFMNSGGSQGMPISVADVSIYTSVMSDAQIKALYNSKCSRYGLSTIP